MTWARVNLGHFVSDHCVVELAHFSSGVGRMLMKLGVLLGLDAKWSHIHTSKLGY